MWYNFNKRGVKKMEGIKYYKYHDLGEDILIKKQHTHNSSVEILHVIKGNGVIVIGDSLYPLRDNCIYFIKQPLLHHSAPENCDTYLRSVANISYDYIHPLAKITGFDKILTTLCDNVCTVLDISDSEYIDKEFKKLKSETKSERSVALINILSCLSKVKKAKYNLDNQITGVIDYINENLSEKITLDMIGKKFHISKYYLCHIFKETTGMSIMSYILNQRIAYAKNLIINTDETISEIAIASGFSCFSYFSRIFKESEKLSPREFRNKYKIKKISRK